MQTDVFPNEYNRLVDMSTSKKVEAAEHNGQDKILFVKDNEPSTHALTYFIMLGIIGGFIAACCVISYLENIILGVIAGFVVLAIAYVVGIGMNSNTAEKYEKSKSNVQLHNLRTREAIKSKISNINEIAEKQKEFYRFEFEKNASEIATKYANSEYAQNAKNIMTSAMFAFIDSADRSENVKIIEKVCRFSVRKDMIFCDFGGTVKFEANGKDTPKSPLEQTAMCQTIAVAIEKSIVDKYPKDASGTKVTVTTEYSYVKDYPVAVITYAASNGNYK